MKDGAARLLQARAPLAVRRIARAFLADARRASQRLHHERDDRALHDFRVALRRLRSTLRIYRPIADARLVGHNTRRRLKRLARATAAGRDAEVGLDWLRRARTRIEEPGRAACDRLIADLKARRDAGYAQARRAIDEDFAPLEKRLRNAVRGSAAHAAAPLLGRAAGAIMRRQADTLAAALNRIRSRRDAAAIHAARIEAKRLRYLLEPLAAGVANGARLVERLRRFQDAFGELCDRQTLSEELIQTAARYEAERSSRALRAVLEGPSESAGDDATADDLLVLARLLSRERKQRYARIERRYLGKRTDLFLAPYRRVADALARPESRATPERRTHDSRRARRGDFGFAVRSARIGPRPLATNGNGSRPGLKHAGPAPAGMTGITGPSIRLSSRKR